MARMTAITNKTAKKKLIERAKVCTSIFSQGTGFMCQRGPPDHGLIFAFGKEHRIAVTMFMVFFPLDIIFVDKDRRVVEIARGLKPFHDYIPKARASYVIELPVGLLGKTKVGDVIEF